MSLQILAQFFFSHPVDIINSSCSRCLVLGRLFSTGVKTGLNGTLICQLMKKIHNDILNLPKRCYDLHVDKCAHQNRFTSDFSAFSKKGSHLQIALISKRFEPQEWDWSQMIDHSKYFPTYCYWKCIYYLL